MYLSFYQLKKAPFHITPDPEFLFLSPSHKEALGSVIYGIEQRKGFVAITGEVGVGKTTILRSYLDNADRQGLKIIYVFNANVSFDGLLKTIYRELGLTVDTNDVYEMVNQLHVILIEEYRQNQNVVLIIDEAQNMPIETLENLRMLSNLETSKDKLIQILLVGQPEFERKLDLHELRQLKQRIAIRCKILPLSPKESLAYIEHRLARASGKRTSVFSKSALNLIVQHARGIPRIINILCDNALITGYGYEKRIISTKIVKEVIGDFTGHSPNRWFGFRLPVSIMLFLSILFWASPFKNKTLMKEDPPSGDALQTVFKAPSGLQNSTEPQNPPLLLDLNKAESVAQPTTAMPTETIGPSPRITDPPVDSPTSGTPDAYQNHEIVPVKEEYEFRTPMQTTDYIYRFVRQGETLSGLITRVYGHCNDELIETVRLDNPRIQNINQIKVGQIIRFPDLERLHR